MRCSGSRRPGLGHRRRGVRPATATSSTSWRRWGSGTWSRCRSTTTVWTEDPAGCVPPYGGRGRVPTAPSAGRGAEPWPRWPRRCPPRRGRPWRSARGRKGPLVFEFAAVRVWAVRHRQARAAGLAAGAAVAGGDARGQVLRQQRRRRDAAGGAGAGGLHAARGRGVSSRTPRATWGWRSTRRGRGSAGTIT